MHMKGTPKTMQADPRYDDLIGEVVDFLDAAIRTATDAGVSRDSLIVDPGIGFGKTIAHNLCLIKRLEALECLDTPILVGSFRKAFIRRILQNDAQADIDPTLPQVETGTQATVAAAIMKGAHIVRVHDVDSTFTTARIIDAIRNVPDNP
jgi:dihydropteroate synthase